MYSREVQENLQAALATLPAQLAALPKEPGTDALRLRTDVTQDMNFYKEHGPLNIVVVGDSVSHGAVGGGVGTVYDTVYHNRLRLMINRTFPTIPVNIINTAVGGETAGYAVRHFARDVLSHHPDLVIVCFGLNDVNLEEAEFSRYLGELFDLCLSNGLQAVYLSPNMLNTYRAPQTEKQYFDYAQKTADMQNSGRMDRYIALACTMARERGIPVADAYAVWRRWQAAGIDTTLLLANCINHPLRELHLLFAAVLYQTIFAVPYDGCEAENEVGMANVTEDGMAAPSLRQGSL